MIQATQEMTQPTLYDALKYMDNDADCRGCSLERRRACQEAMECLKDSPAAEVAAVLETAEQYDTAPAVDAMDSEMAAIMYGTYTRRPMRRGRGRR